MMTYKTLTGSDLSVYPICLGTSGLGTTVAQDDAFRLLDLYVGRGGNFLDTALVYANWLPGERSVSEKTIGRWLKARGNRAELVIATKGGHPELSSMEIPRLSEREIVADLDASLAHLQVDTIDLYYLHRDDPTRPVGEIMDVLQAQVAVGKIRYVGCSNWCADRIRQAQAHAKAHGFTGFVANSMLWNLAFVDPESLVDQGIVMMDKALRQFHVDARMAAVPFSSQAGGLFQKIASGSSDDLSPGLQRMYPLPENRRRLERIVRLADEMGLSVTQIVLGFLLSQPFVTIPIVGSRTPAQLADSLSAVDVRLEPRQVAYLERGAQREEPGVCPA
ncbi:MAG: aldo/keto reductase [Anaerolineae bacterium]